MGTCFYCLRETVVCGDHVVPITRGGPPDAEWNRKDACVPCNNSKSDKLPSEWCPDHAEAIEIEKRVPVIYPRMRNGYIILGEDRATRYVTIRSLCTNFSNEVAVQLSGLSRSDAVIARATTARRAVDRLRLHMEDKINSANVKDPNRERTG